VEPIDLPVGHAPAIYRLWAADGTCLYVGQTRQWHPAARISEHRTKAWWAEVARVDYILVGQRSDLNCAEREQIRALNPRHNKQGVEYASSSTISITTRGEATKPVTMRLPVSITRRLRIAADKRDRTVTNLVVHIVRTWLDENEPEETKG
jgi:excinuclease UvrABC nuclease subunit